MPATAICPQSSCRCQTVAVHSTPDEFLRDCCWYWWMKSSCPGISLSLLFPLSSSLLSSAIKWMLLGNAPKRCPPFSHASSASTHNREGRLFNLAPGPQAGRHSQSGFKIISSFSSNLFLSPVLCAPSIVYTACKIPNNFWVCMLQACKKWPLR
jgi:hypothetical protein